MEVRRCCALAGSTQRERDGATSRICVCVAVPSFARALGGISASRSLDQPMFGRRSARSLAARARDLADSTCTSRGVSKPKRARPRGDGHFSDFMPKSGYTGEISLSAAYDGAAPKSNTEARRHAAVH